MNKTKWIKEWEVKNYIRVKKSRHYDTDDRIDNNIIKYVGSRYKNEIGNVFIVYKDYIKNNYYRGRLKKSAFKSLSEGDIDKVLMLFNSMEERFEKILSDYYGILYELYDNMYSNYMQIKVSNENKYINKFFKEEEVDKIKREKDNIRCGKLALKVWININYIERWLEYVKKDFCRNLRNDIIVLKIEKSN